MSGQNYIGSKISLISLSDIRYVGILHNINSLESTVALQNVQSFGTEGRKANPNEEIAASDNTFDYVVFRGSDIKDLQVFEAPPSYKPEPVIAQYQQVVNPHDNVKPSNSYYSSQQQYFPYITPPPTTKYGNYWRNNDTAPSTSSSVNPTSQQQFQPNPPPPQNMRMPVPENYQQQRTSYPEADYPAPAIVKEQEEKTVVVSPSEKVASNDVHEKQEVSTVKKVEAKEEDENNIVDSLAKQVYELDIKASELSKVTQERVYKQHQQQQKSTMKSTTTRKSVSSSSTTITTTTIRSNKSEFKNSSSSNRSNTTREPTTIASSSNNRRRRSTGGNRNNNNVLPVPRSDFDFASSNAKFDKSEIIAGDQAEKDGIIIHEPDQFYNKEKSFFDDISCESKEYNKGNRSGKHQEERKLNLETFGQANPSGNSQHGKRHRSRGRGRGRSYRGKDFSNKVTNDGSPRVIKEAA